MVLWHGLAPVLAGVVAGMLAALAGARLIQGLLFEVSPRDPEVLTGVVLLMVLTATLASLLPARRAARLEPMKLLREE